MATVTDRPYLVLRPEDHVVLGESDFGMAGLTAAESIGPFVGIQASGPLITVHDSVIDAGLGIGHHPHRFNERLFYIEEGQLDHDDALTASPGTWTPGTSASSRRGAAAWSTPNGTTAPSIPAPTSSCTAPTRFQK